MHDLINDDISTVEIQMIYAVEVTAAPHSTKKIHAKGVPLLRF